MQITEAILNQAEADVPLSGQDISTYYHLSKDEDGNLDIVTVDSTELDTTVQTQATDEDGNLLFDENGDPVYVGVTASTLFQSPEPSLYDRYLTGDGIPPNGAPFTAGISFPLSPVEGQYCLRKDYYPYRLFKFSGRRWVKVEDQVRMTMSNLGASDVGEGDRFEGKPIRNTKLTSFINNTNEATINGKQVKEKQSLSKALRPKADD
jgi:hypothetical protein